MTAAYARMLDKSHEPTVQEIICHLGAEGSGRLNRFEAFLGRNYQLAKALRFPFGNNYGWGYKYGHKAKHLCYVFFEHGAFTVTLQLGDKLVDEVEQKLESLLPQTRELWVNRYPCGEHGGWIHYRVMSDEELNDVTELVGIKCKPLLTIDQNP